MERPDEPGPFRRLFMTDGKFSNGLILLIVLFGVLDIMGVLLYVKGASYWTSVTGGVLCGFVYMLILAFGFYVQEWANG
jgi:hypothetical protein